jgi:hypothetical protein
VDPFYEVRVLVRVSACKLDEYTRYSIGVRIVYGSCFMERFGKSRMG